MKKKLSCVLLIDDDEPTNYYHSLILEEARCTDNVHVAQSGQKALDYLINSKYNSADSNGFPSPDLILLDINMPAMDGWEFLDKYKALKKQHKDKTVLVMLTTSLLSEDILKAKEIPEISGFESKPLTPAIIDKILKKYFGDSLLTDKEDKNKMPL